MRVKYILASFAVLDLSKPMPDGFNHRAIMWLLQT
ncbi:hypothetical protein SAMN04515668_2534 [Hymenobacter arizonensis]|uniref:Uncharacterized protein n=1 Tax=Hymenobacter arizonensis TaxID=1227077 RepID=A0A1I5YY70_HYMAR|nr:hypothetical protein SAMN04515668_2534 [Hymenobacter arizonensis]